MTPAVVLADPVVVELFTSQGCSSCPPADRLLGRLADDSEVVPLSFHVDYWNYIGWTDPFSSEAWSDRQRRYARAFEAGRVYTPQMVFDGRVDCVGSQEDEVRRLIAEAAARPSSGELTVDVGSGAAAGHLRVEVTARVLRAERGGDWKVMVAVFEKGLVTSVPRGENAGRSLHNDNVVRSLTEAFSLPARAGAEGSRRLDLAFGDGWKRDQLGVAVFLQDPSSMHVHGAAVRYLGDAPHPLAPSPTRSLPPGEGESEARVVAPLSRSGGSGWERGRG
jgi:hypothetical protein